MIERSFWFVGVIGLLCLQVGCTRQDEGPVGPPPDAGPHPCGDAGTQVLCAAGVAYVCDGRGSPRSARRCGDEGLLCVDDLGCAACQPGAGACDGQSARVCRADGSGFDLTESCDTEAGRACDVEEGQCVDLCATARASNSYIGCEYWPTVTMNTQLYEDFRFAVAIANPHDFPARVAIYDGATAIETRTVAANGLEIVELPWIDELRGTFLEERSTLVRGGAYRLTSHVPVTVYQFNPLNYRLPQDCTTEGPADRGDRQCFSFSNDASLLLPTHALTGDYLVLTRATHFLEERYTSRTTQRTSPGFVAIVAVETEPTTVSVRSTAHVTASADGVVRRLAPGDTQEFVLTTGDVLQLVSDKPEACTVTSEELAGDGLTLAYCRTSDGYDLTGTEIRTTRGRVSVIAGHNCDFVPSDRWACDHEEESVFPVQSWGKSTVMTITQPFRNEPNLIRVMSAADDNTLAFDPPSVHAPVSLAKGEYVEFLANTAFRVSGSQALLAAQFIVGEKYYGLFDNNRSGGDPSLSYGIPTEQFRSEYTVLTPATFDIGYLNLTAPMNTPVMLDGQLVAGWTRIGTSNDAVVTVQVAPGAHRLESVGNFGVVVYGFGRFASYMYPGGLDLERITVF